LEAESFGRSWELVRVCGSRELRWEMKSVAVVEKREGEISVGCFIARKGTDSH